jgi:catechol 2,3-dioxygenase-like lactoylglutathione lyase family enzyme
VTKVATVLAGVQDLGFTVPDLDQATDFISSFFGAEVVSETGPLADRRRSSMRAFANADVRAVIKGSRLLRTPFLNLKLVEASYPGQREVWPMMLDVGGWHLAGYVDDMDEAMDFLESCDVYVLGPGKKPTTNPPEVGEGSYACHCMTSWGFHFELTSYPNGRATCRNSSITCGTRRFPTAARPFGSQPARPYRASAASSTSASR